MNEFMKALITAAALAVLGGLLLSFGAPIPICVVMFVLSLLFLIVGPWAFEK